MDIPARLNFKACRIEFDKMKLLSLLSSRSRFRACRATNATLAKAMRWSEDRVDDRLWRLEKDGKILRLTSPAEKTESGWKRRRTICFQSSVTPEVGSLLAANLFRSWGRRVRLRIFAACGQLHCTPDQLHEWLRAAERSGWVRVEKRDTGPDYVERIGNFPAISLPNRYCKDSWSPPGPEQPIAERVLQFVQFRSQASPFRPTTHADIAADVGSSRSYTNEVIRQLVTNKKLFPYQRGRTHLLAIDQESAAREAKQPGELWYALSHLRKGPQTTSQLARYLKVDRLTPALRKGLHHQGVEFTKSGHEYLACIGPLPDDFLQKRQQKQTLRKAETNKSRRKLQKLGLGQKDEQLLVDVRYALRLKLFEQFQAGVHPRGLFSLRVAAEEFVNRLSDAQLAEPIRTQRVQDIDPTKMVECVAELLLETHKKGFNPYAGFVQRHLKSEMVYKLFKHQDEKKALDYANAQYLHLHRGDSATGEATSSLNAPGQGSAMLLAPTTSAIA